MERFSNREDHIPTNLDDMKPIMDFSFFFFCFFKEKTKKQKTSATSTRGMHAITDIDHPI